MSKILYKHWQPNQMTMLTLNRANEVIEDYQARGYNLTLRQLYYQLVARDIIPNTQKAYNRIGRILTKAREAGLVDWKAIEDRTRGRKGLRTWDNPADAIQETARTFRIDKWEDQKYRVFVWVEKEALAGVISKACATNNIQVDYVSCRGYMSASTIHREAQNLAWLLEDDQIPVFLHLADHDPSGLDMTRDNIDRLELYSRSKLKRDFFYNRIALNMDQVNKYKPPPNPAKITDSRSPKYIREHGNNSWELDALDPDVLIDLIHKHINKFRDKELWDKKAAREKRYKNKLIKLSSTL